jgi:DtxR family transcriptional regulator, Mn-dependent transcriptional regulator
MLDRRISKDEYLEKLWEMQESGRSTVDELRVAMGDDFETGMVDDLDGEGLVVLDETGAAITLTDMGRGQARRIIRAHRIGDRPLYDVFGGDFETAACEFEHITSLGIVDGICTLLGHPRHCPHGRSIPRGECCRLSTKTVQKAVVPLSDLKVGHSARIAYIECKDDRRMHKLNGLQIRPGTVVRMHQTYPCHVIDCEGSNIALDEDIVANIRVWIDNSACRPEGDAPPAGEVKPGFLQKLKRLGGSPGSGRGGR